MRHDRRLQACWLAGTTAGWLLLALPVRAEQPIPPTPNLTQAVQNGWLEFSVVAGRVSIAWSEFDAINKTFQEGGRTERFNLDAVDSVPSLQYQRTDAVENLSLTLIGGNQVRIVRAGIEEDSSIVPVQFSQAVDESIVLVVGPENDRHEYEAANLWELLLQEPEVCREHLIPLLELLRRQKGLESSISAIENELVVAAQRGERPDFARWTALVAQLGDDRFGKRQAADRELRAAGPAALTFLSNLNLRKLDAEQQFRIRRIVQSLAQETADDSPEQIALSLLGDRSVWLALLSRDDASTRRAAAEELAALMGGKLAFDPDAVPAVRKAQIAAIRQSLAREAAAAEREEAKADADRTR